MRLKLLGAAFAGAFAIAATPKRLPGDRGARQGGVHEEHVLHVPRQRRPGRRPRLGPRESPTTYGPGKASCSRCATRASRCRAIRRSW